MEPDQINQVLIKGVPVPKDVKVMSLNPVRRTYPWEFMEVGDLWEHELAPGDRNRIQASIRFYKLKNPGTDFGYRLTKEPETKKKGIEVWRLK